jgi:cardiolipin synthase
MVNDRAATGATSRIWTTPNALSLLRIAMIPLFVYLMLHEGTELAGLLLFGAVAATDWADGYLARRTGQVSELGKILDPLADRLAIAAGLIAMVVAGAFPLWAALLVLVRDVVILVAGAVLLMTRSARVDVRFIGKVATFGLMLGIGCVAWGGFDLPPAAAAEAIGWVVFSIAIVEYYVATWFYADDLRAAFASPRRS